jgi:hypothetical protein
MNNIEERYRVSQRYMLPYEYEETAEDGVRRRGFRIVRPPEVIANMLIEDIGKEMSSRWWRYSLYFILGVMAATILIAVHVL